MAEAKIRSALLGGGFRTQHELNEMSPDDQRNTLIVELSGRTSQSNLQSFDDPTLAGMGAALDFIRQAKIRTDSELQTMTADDQRNTLIVEIADQTGRGRELQDLNNVELVLLGLGRAWSGEVSQNDFYIRGVLLAGGFRTQHELNAMSADDQRNTLIVELSGRTGQSNLQSFDDATLAGMGAALVFLRQAKIRTDAELKTMTADDQRNTLIVEIAGQTGRGSELQDLSTMQLVWLGLGVEYSVVTARPGGIRPGPLLPYVFGIDSIEILVQKSDNSHSDSDWLTIIVTVADPITKSVVELPPKVHHLSDKVNFGDVIRGPFASDPIHAKDSDIVTINYFVVNLGSSDGEDQFREATEVTNKVVSVVAPAVGAAVGALGGNPGAGLEVGQAVAKAFDAVLDGLSDVFDFLNIHAGPPNCNGVVLQDTLSYSPNQLAQALDQKASKQITGPQENSRCGAAPVSKVNWSITGGRF